MKHAVVCVCVCVCVCVRVRARARVCACVCARARACTMMNNVILQLYLIWFLYIFKIIYIIYV